jgi:hypothetical protein
LVALKRKSVAVNLRHIEEAIELAELFLNETIETIETIETVDKFMQHDL